MNAFDDVKINPSLSLSPSSCAYAAIQLISMTPALPGIQRQRVIHTCLLLHWPRMKLYDEDTREAACDQTRAAAGVGLPATIFH